MKWPFRRPKRAEEDESPLPATNDPEPSKEREEPFVENPRGIWDRLRNVVDRHPGAVGVAGVVTVLSVLHSNKKGDGNVALGAGLLAFGAGYVLAVPENRDYIAQSLSVEAPRIVDVFTRAAKRRSCIPRNLGSVLTPRRDTIKIQAGCLDD